jgi:hypothetical protein
MHTAERSEVAEPTQNITISPKRTLLTVQQFCQRHQAFTPGGLRWLLFHRETNGLAKAVLKVGRRILLDEDAFFTWLDEHQEG